MGIGLQVEAGAVPVGATRGAFVFTLDHLPHGGRSAVLLVHVVETSTDVMRFSFSVRRAHTLGGSLIREPRSDHPSSGPSVVVLSRMTRQVVESLSLQIPTPGVASATLI